ncbi:MAG TPA: DUF4426 domain-containing protein [Luteimonas sp.]|nr:DUF4426 domain-containing protein [Luteimonas sp.]
MRRCLRSAAFAVCAVLSGCGGGGSAPRPAEAAPPPAELVDGDLRIRASAVPSMQLPESVAREYGIQRGEHRVLLLVALRRDTNGDEATLPGSVQAQATDLQGRTQPIALREVRTGELVDHVGIVEVSPPETLRFEIRAIPAGESPRSLQFVREFYP